MAGRLEGRVGVITGGAGYIGAQIARRFVEEGATVVIADLDVTRRDAFVAGLDVGADRIDFIETNATEDASVRAMVEQATERHGGIDILVALVGGSSDAMLHKMTDAEWTRVIDLNLRTTFLATRAVVPQMRERGSGKIVLMSSRSAMGNIGQTNYAAAKAGIIGFTSSLAREMARSKVNVNCVVPGFIDNPRAANMPEKYRQMRIDLNPFQEIGAPEDVANAVLFLASDESRGVTGQALHVHAW